jgi:hypothetical protein
MSSDTRNASEKAIENVLAKYPNITESVLDYQPDSLTFLTRQQSVEVGRIDLLFLSGDELLLIELKAESATQAHVEQLEEYRNHYEQVVIGEKYPSASKLVSILLAPQISDRIRSACTERGLKAIEFNTGEVLQQFENQLFTGHAMFENKPVATSVASLHLISGLIGFLGESTEPKTKDDCVDNLERIAKRPNWNHPNDRMGQFIRLGIRLNLIQQVGKPPLPQMSQLRVTHDDKLLLTERGQTYYQEMPSGPEQVASLSVSQADVITDLLYERPFYSDVTTGMVVFLDTVYDLSRSSDRVRSDALREWYPRKSGQSWNKKSSKSLVEWYGNYLDEIGLISKVKMTDGDESGYQHHLTPEGANMLSYLQVDIGKEMIRA